MVPSTEGIELLTCASRVLGFLESMAALFFMKLVSRFFALMSTWKDWKLWANLEVSLCWQVIQISFPLSQLLHPTCSPLSPPYNLIPTSPLPTLQSSYLLPPSPPYNLVPTSPLLTQQSSYLHLPTLQSSYLLPLSSPNNHPTCISPPYNHPTYSPSPHPTIILPASPHPTIIEPTSPLPSLKI